MPYQPHNFEEKWQDFWVKNETFKAEIDLTREKLYILDMFPYPSGEGLHVGHVEGYTATDIYCRFKRMQGFNVMHVIGWDAFGLPAEQYAIRTGQHPAVTTAKNIDNFRRQIINIGLSYDWSREVSTTDPKFYKWTQWIFTQLYKKGLAYQDNALVNWCPELKAVLANEEVVDGLSEIGGHPVVRIPLQQWILKITKYAQRLNDDLEGLNWPTSVLEMQKNWIGKSVGADFRFNIKDRTEFFYIYTTKAETLFGATYCVMAPELDLVKKITTPEQKAEVEAYLERVSRLSDRARISDKETKTGVFTGAYAINPVNGAAIPIWISDYVLASYGTGAIMAVPAHDLRDFAFAKQFQLNIIKVIESDEECYTGSGKMINSDYLNGLEAAAAAEIVIKKLKEAKLAQERVNFSLRDWIFSRQRYWGEPIPVFFDSEGKDNLVPDSELPLLLPEVVNYEPADNGESPLKKAESWVNFKQDGANFRRETNTMPQWAGSCWYYLRYLDPKNEEQFVSPAAEKYWMPVDLYVGGAEHAVLHLLYARFWHKVLYDAGLVSTSEPFKKLINPGIVLGEDGNKMSKSKGNVVNPSDIIKKYSADALRMFMMFLGPLEKSKPWQTGGIDGIYRFLGRAWNWLVDEDDKLKQFSNEASTEELQLIHTLIKKVTEDFESFKFNTAISAFMIYLNQAILLKSVSRESVKTFLLLLNPLAPHFAEELWAKLGGIKTISYEPWPSYDEKWLEVEKIEIPVQINGKTRAKVDVSPQISETDLVKYIVDHAGLERYLSAGIKKVIYIPQKIINIIV